MRSRKSLVTVYYIFEFLAAMHLFGGVLVPFFTEWGGISQFQAQLLQSWFMFWFFVMEVPTGAVADYLGRKHSIVLGTLTVAVAAVVYGTVPSFGIFLLGEFLFATGNALISGANEAWLYDTLVDEGREGERTAVFARGHSIRLASFLVAAPLGSWLATKFGLNAPMLLTTIPLLGATVVMWWLPEPRQHKKRSETSRYLEVIKEGFQFFYQHPVLWRLAINGILVNSAAYFVIWLYQPLLMQLGVSVGYFGWFHAVLTIGQIIIAQYLSTLEKWVGGSARLFQLSAVLVAGSFITTSAIMQMFSVVAFLLIAGGFGLTYMTFMSAHLQPLIPSDRRATVLSSMSMFRRFALVPLNPFVGFLADRSLSLALATVALLPLIALVAFPVTQKLLQKKAT